MSGRVATTATNQPGPPATTTATESVVPRPAIAVPGFPDAVAMGHGQVWVASAADDTLSRLDPGSGRVVGEPIPVGAFPDAIAVGLGLRVGRQRRRQHGHAARLRPADELVGGPIIVGAFPDAIAVGLGSVWVANADDNTVTRLAAGSGKAIGGPIPVGAFPDAIAVGQGFVWVANAEDNTVTRLAAATGQAHRRADPRRRVSRRHSRGKRVGLGREREQRHGRTAGRPHREADRPTGPRGRPPTRRGRGGRLRVGLKLRRGHGLADRRELRKGRRPANPSRRASDQHRGGTGLGVGRECGRQHDLAACQELRQGGRRLGRLAVDRALSQRDAPSGRSPPRRTSLRASRRACSRRDRPSRRGARRCADLPRPQLESRPCPRERTQPSSITRVGNARRCVSFAPGRADVGRIPCLVVDRRRACPEHEAALRACAATRAAVARGEQRFRLRTPTSRSARGFPGRFAVPLPAMRALLPNR